MSSGTEPKRRVFVGPPPAQVITNTPDSVFQALAYLKELLLLLYHDVILPALAFTAQLLQRIWNGLRDSCKSVTRNKSIHIYVPTHVHTHVRTHTLTHIKPRRQTDRPASKAITYFHSAV